MAHFAQIDENNVVIQVIVVKNDVILDKNGNESEAKGIEFCQSLLGGNWVQTSYNKKFRKNYAGTGYTYDLVRDAFIPLKPFPSWVLNETTCEWVAPISKPEGDLDCVWNEKILNWECKPSVTETAPNAT
ncbi:hypothetical protein EBZ39_03790 [bacterium]|nr:hypothetical protein [bacterium]